MKNKLIALFLSVFLVNALFGTVFTNTVTESEFNTAFADMEFYVDIRAGADENAHEFELGTQTGVSYMGETTWVNNSENSFIIDVSETGFLSATVNSITTPSGNQPGITNPFNEIWIGLKLVTGDDLDELSVINHEYDGVSIDNPSIQDGDAGAWYGFNLVDDQEFSNIADFTITGDLVPDMFLGSAGGGSEGWTYVVFGKYNSAVPEPETYALLFGLTALCAVMIKRRK